MITHFRQAIEEALPWLSSFGAVPAGGMTRLLYSPEWLETQQQFKKRMAASGLETRFDEVGNLYGRLNGTEYPQEVVLSGSHIDTVVNGGNLDGQFGALAAWLAIDWLKTQYIIFAHRGLRSAVGFFYLSGKNGKFCPFSWTAYRRCSPNDRFSERNDYPLPEKRYGIYGSSAGNRHLERHSQVLLPEEQAEWEHRLLWSQMSAVWQRAGQQCENQEATLLL